MSADFLSFSSSSSSEWGNMGGLFSSSWALLESRISSIFSWSLRVSVLLAVTAGFRVPSPKTALDLSVSLISTWSIEKFCGAPKLSNAFKIGGMTPIDSFGGSLPNDCLGWCKVLVIGAFFFSVSCFSDYYSVSFSCSECREVFYYYWYICIC